MSSNGKIESLRQSLTDSNYIKENAFVLLRELSIVANSHERELESQELVLRALENRDSFGPYLPVLNSLVREMGLFPYLDPEALSVKDKIAYEFHRPLNFDSDVVFHRPQAKVYRMLLDGESVVLSAPTSFGKSLIIDAVIASGHYKNIIIIVPTIALIDETRRRLTSRFRNKYRIITHPSQTRGEKNIYVLTQERMLDFDDTDDVDFFVIDEFYKLSPGRDTDDRCWLLNQAFYKLARKSRQFYMLGPGILGLSDEFQKKIKFKFLKEPYHTVVSETKHIAIGKDEFASLIALCKQLDEPTIIFCSSPNRVTNVVRELIKADVGSDSGSLKEAAKWIAYHYHPEWHFVKALQMGIGIHHGRIPRALSQFVVRQFNDEKIRFLVCTSTLIEGVNTKAKNIIVFDNTINKKEMDLFTFNNIQGRAGRMFQHFIGRVYLFYEQPQTDLPFVDVPAYSQDAPPSLLMQIDEDELTEKSKSRLDKYKNLNFVKYETLKENKGVDIDAQLELAETIFNAPDKYHPALSWTQFPSSSQLLVVCELIWDHFNGVRLGAGSVRSAKQLAYLINRLRSKPTTREIISGRLEYLIKNNKGDIDDAVQQILDFLRLWANHHFPRLLRALDNIQKDIFSRLGKSFGNYEFFASMN